MKGYLYLILLVAPAIALPAQGGIFTYKPTTARPKPEMRVPGLLYTVKADPNEGKRAAAAAELGEFDARLFPDMVPVLVDVLQNDTKPTVRREAAVSLGHFPVTPLAGKALHEASAKDPSLKVRLHAWSAYKGYQLHGYHDRPEAPLPKIIGTGEPPLATSHKTVTYNVHKTGPAAGPVVATPPPLPQPTVFSRKPPPLATPASNVPRTLPSPTQEDEGPVLNPQK
jgi:hypothetical protein